MSRIKRLAKEGSWMLFGQIVFVTGSLFLVRVLSEHLSPTEYGQLSLGLTLAGLINQLVMGGLVNAIGRFYVIALEKQDLGSFLYSTRQLLAYATLVVASISVIIVVILGSLGYSQWICLALATLILSVLTGYNATLGAIQNSARQRAIVAIHSGLDAWLKIALIMGILLWFGVSSTAVVIGYAFSSLIITGSQFFFLRRFISTPATSTNNCGEWTQQMLAYAWPFTAWGFFTWLQQVSDRWSLGVFATTADVGLYAVLFQLGFTPITLVTGLTMSFLGPILYARSADASDPSRNANVHLLAWRFTFFCLLLTLASFLITLGMHEWLFHFFVAIQFRSVSYLLPWMVLAGGIFAAGQMLALKMMSDMKPASMTQAKVITALLGVLLNIYGASVAGLDGLVGAQIAFSIIYFVWMALLSSSFFSKNKFTS